MKIDDLITELLKAKNCGVREVCFDTDFSIDGYKYVVLSFKIGDKDMYYKSIIEEGEE